MLYRQGSGGSLHQRSDPAAAEEAATALQSAKDEAAAALQTAKDEAAAALKTLTEEKDTLAAKVAGKLRG